MRKSKYINFGLILFLFLFKTLLFSSSVFAQIPTSTPAPTTAPILPSNPSPNNLGIPYVGCVLPNGVSACPDKLTNDYYKKFCRADGQCERCARGSSFQEQVDDFKRDPTLVHLWVEDPEITEQGKADERARQFIWWVLNHPSIDDHRTLKDVWNFSRNIAIFFTVLIASIFGVGIIIAQRQNFDLKIEVSPLIMKLVFMLLYIVFSASIVLTIIQISEILMKFFIENLGGRDLFNIYFTSNSAENNYIGFHGCRDLNIRVQESVKAELFLLRLTNITYYTMGVMLLLRKVLLWFLLFVSPFLALLMPFIFIRNTGWIWIGVFFQWVFYGPLFALFLGGLAQIWKKGIPFPFNFARTNTFEGYVFPTAINIAYGGPGQEWTATRPPYTNNGNYVDTFTEYIISLIMLWAVTFFPWWLLRIFRDYCCDGILAMKNILMSMYDQMRSGPSPSGPGPLPTSTPIKTSLQIPKDVEVPIRVKMQTIEEIKQTRTQDITQNLQISAKKLTDIARYETNKTTFEAANKNLEYLQNPMRAQSTTERQKYMNLRTELFNRAIKQDTVARQILTATSTSKIEQITSKKQILESTPQVVPVTHVVSVKYSIPQEKIQSVTSTVIQNISQNTTAVNNISQQTQLPQQQVQTILKSYTQNISQPISNIVTNIATQTNVSKEKVKEVLQKTNSMIQNSKIVTKTAQKEQIQTQHVEQIIEALPATLSDSTPMTKVIALKLHVAEDKASTIVTNLFNSVSKNTSIIQHAQTRTGITTEQVKTVITNYAQNINKPADTIAEEIHKTTGIEKEKVKEVVRVVSEDFVAAKDVVKQVAIKENLKEEEINKVMQAQIPLVTEPEKNVEQTIAVPPSVSLEDYEEVKTMWQEQYEKGEVPISENIQSRTEWVDKDIVLITNTLNKLLSVDENVRQQGLDDVGYLLPIFMINNLTGEELIIYLKAKLEAAKAVMKQFNKNKKVETDVEDEEDEVFVERAEKKEEAKTMELEQEMDIPEESKDKQSADNPAPAERTEGTTQVEPAPTAPTDKSTT
jgi:hypothetical protein